MATTAVLGIAQLDRLLAPLPEGAALLLLADPGLDGTPFLYQATHAALKAGRPVVYLVTSRSPDAVAEAMAEHGLSPAPLPGTLRLLDGFSALVGAGSAAAYPVEDPADLATLSATLERAARENPGALLVIESLSTLVDLAGEPRFAAQLAGILAVMRRFGASLSLFTRWPYTLAVLDELSRFDAAVSLRAMEDRAVASQSFCVERASWKPEVDAHPRLYRVVKPGGVLVYIPKVVVTGPHDAGKSSFIRALSDTSVSADRMGTTVAMDHGRVTMDGLTADVFGTPGQSRFDPVLRVIANQAVGVILVVDSTQPGSFPRAREMLEQTWRQGLPAIVAANKQDAPGALAPREVARLLQPPPHVRVVGCVGRDRAAGRAVLRALIEQVLQRRSAASP